MLIPPEGADFDTGLVFRRCKQLRNIDAEFHFVESIPLLPINRLRGILDVASVGFDLADGL